MAGTEQDQLAALLTDEEAAALKPDGEGDGGGEGGGAEDGADPPAGDGADQGGGDEEGQDDDDVEIVAAAPVPDWRPPPEAQAKLDALATERDAIAKKFDDGEITGADFARELDRIADAKTDIKLQASRAGQAEDMRAANWIEVDVAAFLEKYPAYRDNPELNARLDRRVREFQATAQREGKDVFDPDFLTQAHADIVKSSAALLGVDPATIDPSTIPDRPQRRSPDPPTRERPATPPTLARVPAAEPEQITGDTSGYAALDRLMENDPIAYEDAMARLTPAQREGYLEWNGGLAVG